MGITPPRSTDFRFATLLFSQRQPVTVLFKRYTVTTNYTAVKKQTGASCLTYRKRCQTRLGDYRRHGGFQRWMFQTTLKSAATTTSLSNLGLRDAVFVPCHLSGKVSYYFRTRQHRIKRSHIRPITCRSYQHAARSHLVSLYLGSVAH